MKYQTDKELGPFINKWGCFFISILYHVEKQTGKEFSCDEILAIYREAIVRGYVQKELADAQGRPLDGCDVYDPKSVFLLAGGYCKGFYKAPRDFVPASNEVEILCLARADHKGFHFVAGNKNTKTGKLADEIAFDPIKGGSLTAKLGWIDSKRVLIC